MSNEDSNMDSDNIENKRKTRVDSIELNPKQKQFVENYLFNGNNGTKAYMLAYGNNNERSCAVRANELLKVEKIRNEIATRQAELREHHLTHIATAEEVLQFYTQIMINPDNKLDHRMKAGEYIGKSMGLFIERHEVNSNTDFQINLGFTENDVRKIVEHKTLDVIEMNEDENGVVDEDEDENEY